MKKSLLFLSLIFLFVIFAASARADFTITTNLTTNTVCPGSTIVIEDIVSGSPGTYTVTISGTAATFATAVPQGFWLEPETSRVIYSYITPTSKTSPGNYVLDVTIGSGQKVKTVRHNLIVENCHNTIIKVEPISQPICACDRKSFLLKITNNGKYLENYDLDVEGPASQWTELSSKSITLAPNASATVTAYITMPCNVKGDYELNFLIKAKSEYSRANVKANASVISCYDYAMSTEKTYYSMCEADKLTVPVKIKNFGTQNNIYKINTYAPNWTHIDLNKLTIASNNEGTFNLLAEPPYGTQGNFTVNFDVMSEFGKVQKKYDIQLDVSKCYGVSVLIDDEKDKICNALSNTYPVIIRNNGKFMNTYDITLEAPEWVTISEKHVTLNASKEKTLTLDIHPPYNLNSSDYKIKVKAYDAKSKVSAEDTITITTVTLNECYQPAISTKDDQMTVSRDGTATALFIVENKGTNDANYTMGISGTATKFSQINPGTISLKATKAETLYLYVAPPVDTPLDTYSVTVTVRLKDTTILAAKTITINVVEAGKISQPPVQPPTNVTNQTQVSQPSFFSKIIDWIVSLFTPKTTANVTNATNETKKPTNITTNQTTNATKQTNATKTTTNKTTNHAPTLAKQIPQVNIKSGAKEIISLNDYFSDSDNDDLTYVTVKPMNMTVTLAGDKVTIEPNKGFTGTREITFYASDGKDITQSNIVKIVVTESTQTNQTSNQTNKTTTQTNATKTTNKTNATNESEEIEITGKEKEETSETSPNYWGLIIVAIVIVAIIIILLSGLGKKIIRYFEEEPTNGKKNNNHK